MRESVFKAEHCHEGICINMGLIYLSQVDYGIRGYDSELFTKVTLRVSKYVDSSVILQYIQTFYKDTITTQFITNQATLTASAITVHSTKNLVDNLFQSIPWRGRNVVSLVLFNLIHICKEVHLFRLMDRRLADEFVSKVQHWIYKYHGI